MKRMLLAASTALDRNSLLAALARVISSFSRRSQKDLTYLIDNINPILNSSQSPNSISKINSL
jgi:hypothetical protein